MAILGRFECQVLVNGEPLKEYEDEDDEQDHDNTVSEEDASSRMSVKYIEGAAGANFAIKCHVKPGIRFVEADYLEMEIHLDGQYSSGPVLTKERYSETKNQGWSATRSGIPSGNGLQGFELRKFQFGELVTGEFPTLPNMEELKLRYDALGSINVEFWRKMTLSIGTSRKCEELNAGEVIPEKMLKGRALTLRARRDFPPKQSSFGKAEKAPSYNFYKGKKLGEHPVARFMFKYRSTEALKQLLVIPRTRAPTPLEERPIEALSVEELRERLRRREAEAVRLQVKKEESEGNPHTPSALKRFREDMGVSDDDDVEAIAERSAHKKQRPAVAQEVIELSD